MILLGEVYHFMNPIKWINGWRAFIRLWVLVKWNQKFLPRIGSRSSRRRNTKIIKMTDRLFAHIEKFYTIAESTGGYTGFILTMRLRKVLDTLFRSDLPAYTHRVVIQKTIPLISQGYSPEINGYFDSPIWAYVKAIECETHPTEFVENNLKWALSEIYEKDLRTWTRLEEAYAKIIAERNLSSELLYELCDYERPGIWLPASQNPNCPDEGLVLLALQGKTEDELVDFERAGR